MSISPTCCGWPADLRPASRSRRRMRPRRRPADATSSPALAISTPTSTSRRPTCTPPRCRAVQSLKLKATLAARQLAISDFDLGWAGGHTRGRLGVDLRQPLALLDVSLATSGVRVESLLPARDGDKRLSGTLRASLALKASGNTVDALRDSLGGAGSMRLRDGTISSLLDAEMGLEGGKLVRTLLSGAEALALPCAAAQFDVNEGRAHLRELVVDSANTRTVGSGSLDLRDLSIDLVLTPQPKRPGLFELRRSIRFFGPLPRPQPHPGRPGRAAGRGGLRGKRVLMRRLAPHQRALAEQALDQVDGDLGGAVADVERRVELHHVERGEGAGVGDHLHAQLRLAIGRAALHGGADAGAMSASRKSTSKLTCRWVLASMVASASSIVWRMPISSM